MAVNIQKLLRQNIKNLQPYSSARDEFPGAEGVFLDANENAFGSALENAAYNRYPDPLQIKIKEKLARLEGVEENQIFLGNGSDEAIDLLIRAFCNPGTDNILLLPPTYGMYKVSAEINAVAIIDVPLNADFQVDVEKVLDQWDENTKIIFICSPNNPSGNLLNREDILKIIQYFEGLVVVDEAYIDFCMNKSMVKFIQEYNNLVVLKTFSKAWGLAGLRLGMAFASAEIIEIYNKIKAPYNINALTQELVLKALDNPALKNEMLNKILAQKEKLINQLSKINCVQKIYPSDANFLLVKVSDALKIYHYLIEKKIIVRNRSNVKLCENCLRITVGTAEENKNLVTALEDFS